MACLRLSRIAGHLNPSACDSAKFDKSAPIHAAGGTPSGPKTEAELRVELAAAYRIVAHLGWDDGIQNHLTVRIPGIANQYLINSYGMGFEEVTASSLIKIDHDGNVLDAGSVAGAVNIAGFNIHGAVHKARPDALCVMHTHETNCAAVASMKCGFLPGLSQHALLCGEIPIHKYGPTVGPYAELECASMMKDMGPLSRALLLENHGVIVVGESIAEAMIRLWYVTKACEIQVRALSGILGVDGVNTVDDPKLREGFAKGGIEFFKTVGLAEFAHHCRVVDRVNPGYKD